MTAASSTSASVWPGPADGPIGALGGPDPPGGAPPQARLRAGFRHALADALAQLPERQRACWLLTQVEGLGQREAAIALRMTPDAVRGQVALARQSLVTSLEDWR